MISLPLYGKEQIPMKKLWIFLVIFCMMAGSLRISAENYWLEDSISSGDTRVIAIPQPEGEIDPGMVYFTQEFTFHSPLTFSATLTLPLSKSAIVC